MASQRQFTFTTLRPFEYTLGIGAPAGSKGGSNTPLRFYERGAFWAFVFFGLVLTGGIIGIVVGRANASDGTSEGLGSVGAGATVTPLPTAAPTAAPTNAPTATPTTAAPTIAPPPPPPAPLFGPGYRLVANSDHMPTYNQAWYYHPSISERSLSVSTAFAMMLGYLTQTNVVQELPANYAYKAHSTTNMFDSQGWNDYLHDGPQQTLAHPPGRFWINAISYPYHCPSLNWWVNTNDLGAYNVYGWGASGTRADSMMTGMTEFFSRTGPASVTTGWAYHKAVPSGATSHGGTMPATWGVNNIVDHSVVYSGLSASVTANRPVVLLLDSYNPVARATLAANHSAYYMGAAATSSANGDVYVLKPDNPPHAHGHAVVLVGISAYAGCTHLVVRDGVASTAKNVMLPWSESCSTNAAHRPLWDALVASFHVNAQS